MKGKPDKKDAGNEKQNKDESKKWAARKKENKK